MSDHKSLAELAERVWSKVPEARAKGDRWTLNKHMRCVSTYDGAEFPHPGPEAAIEAACVRWLVEYGSPTHCLMAFQFANKSDGFYVGWAMKSGYPEPYQLAEAPTLTEALLLAVEAAGAKP